MKKFKSFLALLLLGGLVVTGCGKDKTPSNSGGSQQNSGGSQSGDSGSGGGNQGGEGGDQQGGGGQQGGEGGGQQGGGGEGGGQQGGGEVPAESQFVNKKFDFDSVSYPQNATIETALNQNYQGAYASFFQSGKFELVSVVNTYTMALLGTFTVAEDDSYARLDVLKEYDGESEAYDYVTSGTFVTNIRYNEGLQKYVLPMRQEVEHNVINFDVYLTRSNEAPEPVNLPDDPNGETFDPQYQVYKDVWDRLIVNRGLIHSNASNYIVTHDTTIFEVDDGTKFYEHWTTGSPNSGYYHERTSIVGNSYNYNFTIVAEGQVSPASPVEYGVDFFDEYVGLAPIPFNWMQYNSVGHYYFRNSYTYQNSFSGSRTLNNYRVYFGSNYRIQKITYENDSHVAYEFNFSGYNTVDIDIPEAGGGGGGGGGGEPAPTNSYLNARQSFLTATGITVPLINDLTASFYENDDPVYYMFSTGNGAESSIFNTFISSFDGQLTSPEWSKGDLADNETYSRYIYTDTSGDQVFVEFYKGDAYLCATYYEHTIDPVTTPPYLKYGTSGYWYEQEMVASGGNVAQIENFQLYGGEEFAINVDGSVWKYFDNFVIGDPDTSEGLITEGTTVENGHHYFHVETTGYFSIYVNGEGNVYIVHETGGGGGGGGGDPVPAVWPGDYVSAALTTWGIANDTVPACDGTGVTSFTTYPVGAVAVDDDEFVIGAIGGADKLESYKSALGLAGYVEGGYGMYMTTNGELGIMVSASDGNLTIAVLHLAGGGLGPVIPSEPSIYYIRSGEEYFELLDLDSEHNQYYCEGMYFNEGEEFCISLGSGNFLFYEDFLAHMGDPDTANGKITEGQDTMPGYHMMHVEEDGYYDIYVNSSNELYIVHGPQAPSAQFMMFGSDLNGWDYEELTQNGTQWEIENVWLDENTEIKFKIGDNWYKANKFVDTEADKDQIDAAGENLVALANGYYSFYINMNEGGNIYVVYSAD